MNREPGEGQGRPARPCTYDLEVLHTGIHVYRRDKLKLQNGRGIIILKRRCKELGCKINNNTYLTLLKFLLILIYSDKKEDNISFFIRTTEDGKLQASVDKYIDIF